MSEQTTPYETKVSILAELWLNYRNDEEFQDFIEYNDLGLPLAYAIHENIVKTSNIAQTFIEETFALLLAGLDLPESDSYETLDDLLSLPRAE